MKILLVQDHLRRGGTERQTVLLANAFAADGHAAVLLTFRPGGALAGTLAAAVPHRALQPFDTGLDWFAPGLPGAVRRTQPEIVLCMGRMANCRAGGIQKNFPSVAVIATMRTGRPLPWLFRRSLHRVRHLVANSHAAARLLTGQHGVPAGRITVIHNALVFPALDSFDSVVGRSLRDLRRCRMENGGLGETSLPQTAKSSRAVFPPAPVVLLNVAMFRPEKNQRELIGLCAHLPAHIDWRLILAGDGPTRDACRRIAVRKGLAARVQFPGFVADPTSLYGAADLAVLTSQSESLPNFLCEAQAHGLPAIAYDLAGVGECFQPGRSGCLVPNRDRAAFLARLIPLIEDASLRARFSAAARAYARETFDPGRQVGSYLNLFARLIV